MEKLKIKSLQKINKRHTIKEKAIEIGIIISLKIEQEKIAIIERKPKEKHKTTKFLQSSRS
jgi:hypothetical protein